MVGTNDVGRIGQLGPFLHFNGSQHAPLKKSGPPSHELERLWIPSTLSEQVFEKWIEDKDAEEEHEQEPELVQHSERCKQPHCKHVPAVIGPRNRIRTAFTFMAVHQVAYKSNRAAIFAHQ